MRPGVDQGNHYDNREFLPDTRQVASVVSFPPMAIQGSGIGRANLHGVSALGRPQQRKCVMETATQDVEVAVNRLIEICREGQQGFQAAARAVQVPQLRAELEEYGRQRAEFCAALENALGDSGLRPTSYAAIPGVLRRGWMNLNGAIGEPVQTVLTACERGDDAARQTYSE